MADASEERRTRSAGPGLGPWDCPQPPGRARGRTAPVVVHQPSGAGGRQVSVGGRPVGVAWSLSDVLGVVRRIGIALNHEEAATTPLIEWRGGGTTAWPRPRPAPPAEPTAAP
ncbi:MULTISPECIES: hypothetical protein [unclassified Streptomyces]|uniref:hypothetical protein n=1 Tax=unclassified Streptomyces TaxID=2593676 RepID=UPI003D760FEB